MGAMSFGDGSRETWALGYEAAAPFFRQALDLGINFWDTANIYSFGASEEIVGRAIKEFTRRHDGVPRPGSADAAPPRAPGARRR
jgi:1-deoxyxylulose-5-phosphate synthase